MSRTLSILGATGSVGQSTARVAAYHKGYFDVEVVTAGRNAQALARIARDLNARHAVVAEKSAYQDLKTALSGTSVQCSAGEQALLDAAAIETDCTMAAIAGFDGLAPLIRAIRASRCVAIANKEPLVAAGALIRHEAEKAGTKILPVDSEHNALFQVFEENNRDAIEQLILTASGGPFYSWTAAQMAAATPEQALKHPNWSMGTKISIDSATMFNKALEVIEAHYLFNMPAAQIEVLVHPQSVVHSMIAYNDGSVLSQMGAADMCTPIANALAWPGRMATPGDRLDWRAMGPLEFMPPDTGRFPALNMAYEALEAGQGACIALNAANEVAVNAFLNKTISFLDIPRLVQDILENQNLSFPADAIYSLKEIKNFDRHIRDVLLSVIDSQG